MKPLGLDMDFAIACIKLQNTGEAKECHTNARLTFKALKKLGYKVKLCKGIYQNLPKNIKHSWIETKGKILETDCRQLREEGDIMPDEFCAVLDKTKFKHRYLEEFEDE